MPNRETIRQWVETLRATDIWEPPMTCPSGGVSVFQFLLNQEENGEPFYVDTDASGNAVKVFPNR